jgi:hypothetical protein
MTDKDYEAMLLDRTKTLSALFVVANMSTLFQKAGGRNAVSKYFAERKRNSFSASLQRFMVELTTCITDRENCPRLVRIMGFNDHVQKLEKFEKTLEQLEEQGRKLGLVIPSLVANPTS